jgi:hypothetical protein
MLVSLLSEMIGDSKIEIILTIALLSFLSLAWCKACRAVERPFRRLHKENVFNSAVKFVEVPVTKENAYLHQGLGIPSLPFAHIYQTNKSSGAGSILVEEMKINKNVFGDFKQTLENYVKGECPITYKDDGKGIEARESSHKNN